jgi:hypothetical protein
MNPTKVRRNRFVAILLGSLAFGTIATEGVSTRLFAQQPAATGLSGVAPTPVAIQFMQPATQSSGVRSAISDSSKGSRTPVAFAGSSFNHGVSRAGAPSTPTIQVATSDLAVLPTTPAPVATGVYSPRATMAMPSIQPFPAKASTPAGSISGVVVPASAPTFYSEANEPEGKLLSSKIISSSEPVIISERPIDPSGSDAIPSGKLTATQPIPMADPYGFSGAAAVPAESMYPGSYGGGYARRGVPSTMSGYSSIRNSNNSCCPEDCRQYYGGYEAVWLRREGDQAFSLSRGNFFRDWGYDFGHRITIGQMFDCTDGVELVYTLQSVLTGGLGYGPAQVSGFNNAVQHVQFHQSRLQMVEANRKWFAWDIMSTSIGISAIDYDEDYGFDSTLQNGNRSSFRTSTRNFLVGLHVGGDVMRPVSQRLAIGSRSRLGVYANFNEGRMAMVNEGATIINARREDTDIAGVVNLGGVARYRILPRVVATCGYEMLYIAGVATASNQRYVPVNPGTGTRYSASDTIFFHGGTAGLEISY